MKKICAFLLALLFIYFFKINLSVSANSNVSSLENDNIIGCSQDIIGDIKSLDELVLKNRLIDYDESMFKEYDNESNNVYLTAIMMLYEEKSKGKIFEFETSILQNGDHCTENFYLGYANYVSKKKDNNIYVLYEDQGSRYKYNTKYYLEYEFNLNNYSTYTKDLFLTTRTHDAVQISQANNSILIIFYINITGDVDVQLDGTNIKDLVKQGIKKFQNDYLLFSRFSKVYVEIVEKTGPTCKRSIDYYMDCQQYVNVNVNNSNGRSHVSFTNYIFWNSRNLGDVTLYTDGSSSSYFKKVVAHEFGHILGLDDAYENNYYIAYHPDAKTVLGSNFETLMDNMNYIYNHDMEMILLAWYSQERQYYISWKLFGLDFITVFKQSDALSGLKFVSEGEFIKILSPSC